ncbi:MAG: hypothetical protein HZB13_16655 [Acidobacteria bacterium]|nr:hypothetical protein [Acidobacteriota bacterium]
MNIELARRALLWCTVLNWAVLLLWFWLYILLRKWLHGVWNGWFRMTMTAEQYDALNYGGMTLYKVGILLLNLTPFAALYLAG